MHTFKKLPNNSPKTVAKRRIKELSIKLLYPVASCGRKNPPPNPAGEKI
jgi:hypothetical protein